MSEPGKDEALNVEFEERQIRYVQRGEPPETVLVRFTDPAPAVAISVSPTEAAQDNFTTADTLDVKIVRPQYAKQGLGEWADPLSSGSPRPVYVRYRGVELQWHPGRAVLLCDPEQVEALLAAVAEFAHYEGELRRIEQEIAAAWHEIEQDNTLAFDVTPTDLGRSDAVGIRMERTFRRRILFARIEPHLGLPAADLPAAAQKLGEELREKAGVESRAEIVDSQLEVFEHIYEMASQRMGEYKAARQGHIMEWVIIVVLAAETLLMLAQTIWRLHQ